MFFHGSLSQLRSFYGLHQEIVAEGMLKGIRSAHDKSLLKKGGLKSRRVLETGVLKQKTII